MSRASYTPEMLEVIRKGIASGKTARQVAEALGMRRQLVWQIARRHNLGTWVKDAWKFQIPEGFEKFYLSHQVKEAVARYGVSRETIARWAKQKGIARPPRVKKEKPAKPFTIDQHRAFKPASSVVHKEDTAAGEAQRYLQTQGYVPVFRSDNLGREPKPRGRFWRCGRRVLTDAEIVALAGEVRERRERRVQIGRGL